MSKLRFNITMSLDGFVAGADQSEENPLGVGGMDLQPVALPAGGLSRLSHSYDTRLAIRVRSQP